MNSLCLLLCLIIPVQCVNSNLGQDLRWFDITTIEEYSGGASGYQYIIEIEMDSLSKTVVTENDPYWFKYYKQFWNSNGFMYVSNDATPDSASRQRGCGPRRISFNSAGYPSNEGTFYNMHDCLWVADGCGYPYVNHFMSQVVDSNGHVWIPGTSSLGPNYYPTTCNTCGVTMEFGIFTNIYRTDFSPYSCVYGASHDWTTILPGEVSPLGFAVVPASNVGFPSVQWVFIVPKGHTTITSTCRPNILGCSNNVESGGSYIVYDPPLWGPSDEQTVSILLDEGVASFGYNQYITQDDYNSEGFYLFELENGLWQISRLNSFNEAWSHIKSTKSLTINGSGNRFGKAVSNAILMGEQAHISTFVHYYMPQKVGPSEYENADNSRLTNALGNVFENSKNEQVWINLQTHSWAGYVVTTSCNNKCDYINHISYAPATMPDMWNNLANGYNRWKGITQIFYSTKDIISGSTIYGAEHNGANLNGNRITTTNTRTSHSLSSFVATTSPTFR